MSARHVYLVTGLLLGVYFLLMESIRSDLAEVHQTIRKIAVERGFAEWVPDKEGNTTFKWKEEIRFENQD